MQLAIATETAEKTAEDNARLYTNELERRKDAETLSKVARTLSTLLKMDELPQQILKQLANLIPYERGALIMEDTQGATRIVAHMGFPENAYADDLLSQIDSEGAYARIAQSGEALIIEDVAISGTWKPVDWLLVNHSWMGVPLFSKSKVIGMLSLTRQAVADFSHDDLLLVTTFGMQAAISLENARLYDEVTRFNELMEKLVAQRVEELNIAYNKLEKLDKNKSSFIQVTAHELRTPLTVMKGYLGMLKATPAIQENESLAQVVDGVLKGADRLHMIVNSMLDVARLEGQTITPHLETVIVGLVLQLVQKEYKNEMAERNIALLFEEGVNSLPFIQADPDLLQKALDAVIVNAIKFTPDGGSISLGGRVVTDEQMGPCLEIHIRDTGIGIDLANQQVIFEKLFQLGKVELHSSGRTKFKGGGPGLGLAIAAGIVKAHNGKIWVESPGCDEEKLPGSTFFIRLQLPKNS
jgi:signal transduction histidine kinase